MNRAQALPLHRRAILVVGPTPPPFHGVAVATDQILSSTKLRQEFDLLSLDTRDRRGLSNINRLDLTNLTLALKHGAIFIHLLLTKRPELIYLPISQATLAFLRDCLFLLPSRVLGKKVVIHLHGSSFRDFYRSASFAIRFLIRHVLRGASYIIVLGEDLRTVFSGLVPDERVRVIPNGIADFVGETPRPAPPRTIRRVLFLSSLRREKGIFDVLQAIPEVLRQGSPVVFTFAGEWVGEGDRLLATRLLRDLGLERAVEFTGPVGPDAKRRLLLESDVFVLPSYMEGQPFALLEAMCASLPIVTTRTGAVPELVDDGFNGFLVDKQRPDQVAGRIRLLLEDEGLRSRMGRAGRERMLDRFTADRFVGDTTQIFRDALEDGH